MKQHMLTHKIRDMPQHMFENSMQSSSLEGNSGHSYSINCQMGIDKQIDDADADNGNSSNSATPENQQLSQQEYDSAARRAYSPAAEMDSSLSSADEPMIKKLSKSIIHRF